MNLWTDEQLLVTVRGPTGVRELVVGKPFARVGSHPGSEVLLEDPSVAKRAVYLHATGDGVFCLDLDVEDSVAQKRGRWMSPSDAVQIGPYSLAARLASGNGRPDVPAASPVAWGSAGVPLPVINVHCQRLLKDKRRFRARLNVVGRRPQCALQLRGARVSSFHCVMFWDQRRLFCVDLLSSNGTKLNGEPFDCGEIQLNDRLDVGEFMLVYYRWSPRRSMQPGWQPEHDAAHEDHEADGHGRAPLRDAASPPSGAEADLALATHLAEEDGSGIVRDAAAPATAADDRAQQENMRLRQALAEQSEQLAAAHEQLQAQAAAAADERARWDADRAARQAAEQDWHDQRRLFEQQAGELGQQVERLQGEVAAARREHAGVGGELTAQAARWTQERSEFELRIAELAQRLAEQSAQSQGETVRLTRERTAAEAAKVDLQAQHEALAARLGESGRQAQKLKADLALANEAAAQYQITIDELTQQRDAALAQLAAPRTPAVSTEHEAHRQQLAADVARLMQERDELHAQWTQSSERFAQQIAQLSVQAARHAEERDAAVAAHDQWQRERQRLNEQLAERGQQLAAARAELSAAAMERERCQAQHAQREAAAKALAQQKDAQIARLSQERHDLQAQWAAATQQLAAQVERSQDQSSRLAEQRRSFEAERESWLAERAGQAEQLAENSEQLNQAKQELAAARTRLASGEAELQSSPASPPSFDTLLVSMTTAEAKEAAFPAAEPGPTGDDLATELLPTPSSERAAETLPALMRSETPAGRRSKAQTREMVAFVGDRLVDLDQTQRRRSLILWASVAAGTVVLSAMILGGWFFFR